MSIVQAFWGGQLNLPKQGMEDFRLDACRSQIIKTLLDDFVVHALLDLFVSHVLTSCLTGFYMFLLAFVMLNDFVALSVLTCKMCNEMF